ncbi:MAG TPA: hypothetical protein VNA16_02355 [Abditibacteriaceae bacterium]|nr:hypothetical protein [Abditibacteriaceae bacterium]
MEHESHQETQGQAAELEAALDEALEDQPRAAELRHMRSLLQERRIRLTEDMNAEEDDATRAKLQRDLAKLDEQIAVLGEEAEITKFVEDAVRVGIEMRRYGS